MNRFRQIDLQQRGLGDPETQQRLKLTAEQKDRIKAIESQLQQDAVEVRRKRAKDTGEQLQKLAHAAREKSVAVLTDDQKKAWKELTGEPVNLPFELLPPGRPQFRAIDPKKIRPKDPNIPDIYRTPPKKIDF
jgi:hypothetical protein